MKLIRTFLVLILFNAVSLKAEIINGELYEANKMAKYFDTSELISYGNIVFGILKHVGKIEDENKQFIFEGEYLYFCKLSELKHVGGRTKNFDANFKLISIDDNESKYDVYPLNFKETSDVYHRLFGTKNFEKFLKNKCSARSKEYPKYDVPVFLTDQAVTLLKINTFKNDVKFKYAWLDIRKIDTEFHKLRDGSIDMSMGKPYERKKISNSGDFQKIYFGADCKDKKIAELRYFNYNKTGNVIDSKEIDDIPKNYKEVIPDTLGESSLKAICSL